MSRLWMPKMKWRFSQTVKAPHFGYPLDMQLFDTETVLKQAEMIANELMGT